MKRIITIVLAFCSIGLLAYVGGSVTKFFGDIDMQKLYRVINIAEPKNDSDAATKYYVDHAGGGGSGVTKEYVDSQDTATLTSAKTYADTKANSAVATANAYTDTKSADTLATAKEFTTTIAASTLSQANTFATSKANEALVQAKAYTDSKSTGGVGTPVMTFIAGDAYAPVQQVVEGQSVCMVVLRQFTAPLKFRTSNSSVTITPSEIASKRYYPGDTVYASVNFPESVTNEFAFIVSGNDTDIANFLAQPVTVPSDVYVSFDKKTWYKQGQGADISQFVPAFGPTHTFPVYVKSDRTYVEGVVSFSATDYSSSLAWTCVPQSIEYEGSSKTIEYTCKTGSATDLSDHGLLLIVSFEGSGTKGETYPKKSVGPFKAINLIPEVL